MYDRAHRHIFTMGRYRKLYMEIDAENRSSIALAKVWASCARRTCASTKQPITGVCDLLVYGLPHPRVGASGREKQARAFPAQFPEASMG